MVANAELLNFDKAVRSLQELDKRVRRTVMAKAVRAGGSANLKAVRARAPKGKNRILKTSFTQKVKRYPSGAVSVVGQDLRKRSMKSKKKRLRGGGISGRGEVVPDHLVESPTAAHGISGKPVLSWRVGRSQVAARRIRHPGTRGHFFIARASLASMSSARRKATAKLIIEQNKIVDAVKSTEVRA